MNRRDWERVVELFHDALERDERERETFLRSECPSESVRDTVERLLEDDARSDEARFLESQAAALAPGSIIGKYRVIQSIGRGGMGEVFRARDTLLERDVAIKILPVGFTSGERLERFKREAMAASSINHPNVVTIHDLALDGDPPYIAMELVEGQSLAELVSPPLPPTEALALVRQVAVGLASAHDNGVVHRDLKLENLMMTRDGLLKVVDFGLAKIGTLSLGAGDDAGEPLSRALTGAGAVAGTPRYMSPEQARGEEVDARTDLWSLGVVLFKLATGRWPIEAESAADLLARLREDGESPLGDDASRHHDPVLRIAAKAMQRSREGRYSSANDMLTDIDGALAALERRPRGRLLAGVAALVLLVAAIVLVVRPTPSATPIDATFTQLTSTLGEEASPIPVPGDNTIIYAAVHGPDSDWDVLTRSTVGQSVTNLTEGSTVDDWQPALSRDGERLAFRSERDGGGLFVMNRRSRTVEQITEFGYYPDWSPDGQSLVFSSKTFVNPALRSRGSELWRVDVETGNVSKIFDGDAIQPKWSPGGERIAFWGLDGSSARRDIWTVDVDGSSLQRVTDEPSMDWSPAWSPDGDYLYFSSDRGGSMNLWRVPLDERSGRVLREPVPVTTGALSQKWFPAVSASGDEVVYAERVRTVNIQRVRFDPVRGETLSEPEPVTESTRTAMGPDVSPDGKWLAYWTETPEDIVVASIEGNEVRSLTDDPERDRVPRWSPDGERIVFSSDRSGNFELWSIRPDGSELTQLTFGGDSSIVFLAWSPDGHAVVFYDAVTNSAFVQDLFDPASRTLVASGFVPWSWSPDGEWIAGPGYRPGVKGVLLHSLRTQSRVALTEHGGLPVWLGDSRRLLFSTVNGIELVDRTTGTTQPILDVTPDQIFTLTLSPDEEWLYFDRETVESDIWSLTLQ